jgi:type IV secretion system protein VirD4
VKQPGARGGELTAIVAIAIVIAAPVAVVWLASSAAGLLRGGRPLVLSLLTAAKVAASLPAHLANPRIAWPARLRARLPATATLDLLLVAVTVLVVAIGVLALLIVVRYGAGRVGPGRAARFAGRSELASLRVRAPTAGRVTLGSHGRRLIAAEPRVSVLGVGPAQSGKTTGLVVPAIVEWQGPVLSTSVKADVVHDTHHARATNGQVLVFDPTASSTLTHSPWSPITAAQTWEGARRTAANLLGVADQGAVHNIDDVFWKPAGARYLAPLLLAAAHAQLTMGDVLRWVAVIAKDEPTEVLEDPGIAGATAALEALRSVWSADHRLRSSLMQTIATGLDAWQEPAIAAATIGQSQINPHTLLDGRNTLYLIAPAHEQRRLRGLFTALVADVTAAAFERSARSGKPINPPLLLALDEAANIAPLPNLDEIASTGPGQGVQLLTILQNISQAQDRWGRDRAETIIANHRARLFCSGIGDHATLDHLQRTLGDEEITRTASHRQSPLTRGSRTHSTDFRALAAPHRVRQAHANTALLVYGRLAPAWINLRPWYAHRRLRQLVTKTVAAPGARATQAAETTLPGSYDSDALIR